jgi:hypothetical protein
MANNKGGGEEDEALLEKTKLINFGLRTECKLIACVYRCNCLLGPPSVCHHCYPHLSLSLSLSYLLQPTLPDHI